jgi:hypothetical protein
MKFSIGIPVSIRTPTLLLVASLAANAGLVAVILVKAPYVFQASTYGVGHRDDTASASSKTSLSNTKAGSLTSLLGNLDKGDLKTMAARLREAGASPAVIRAIVGARLNELYKEKRRDLAAQMVAHPYWTKKFGQYDNKIIAALTKLGKEQNDELKELLGPDADEGTDPLSEAFARAQEGGIPHQNYLRLQAIQNDYDQMKAELNMTANGTWLPEDAAKLAYLNKEEQEDMAKALSPEDCLEYNLRTSPEASFLRQSLQAFNPTESEFRAIFQAQSSFDDQYGSQFQQQTQEQQLARQAHQSDLLASIESALGPDRFAQYKEETDPSFVTASNLVDRLGLPATTTDQVASIQSDINKQADAIIADANLSLADKTSQLARLSDEATGKITGLLGDSGMAAYKQSAGWWMYRLKPPGK